MPNHIEFLRKIDPYNLFLLEEASKFKDLEDFWLNYNDPVAFINILCSRLGKPGHNSRRKLLKTLNDCSFVFKTNKEVDNIRSAICAYVKKAISLDTFKEICKINVYTKYYHMDVICHVAWVKTPGCDTDFIVGLTEGDKLKICSIIRKNYPKLTRK